MTCCACQREVDGARGDSVWICQDCLAAARQAAAPDVPAAVVEAALRLIQGDPHQWSTRPCPTCEAVTRLLDHPFGCRRAP